MLLDVRNPRTGGRFPPAGVDGRRVAAKAARLRNNQPAGRRWESRRGAA
jgi:hypothetical protein